MNAELLHLRQLLWAALDTDDRDEWACLVSRAAAIAADVHNEYRQTQGLPVPQTIFDPRHGDFLDPTEWDQLERAGFTFDGQWWTSPNGARHSYANALALVGSGQ